jgi:hypothetical protein
LKKRANEAKKFAKESGRNVVAVWSADGSELAVNRCTMHRGTEYDERRWKRDMHRATVSDIGNTLEV